ncbi:MAG: M48 family metalloprotease [Patescibacteria group bacterium]|nr:M48 family metalloprotease [Patescibacteria group bacterium]MDE1965829.1 M48 family metalloprotease [Patescibacteria group bacterium]
MPSLYDERASNIRRTWLLITGFLVMVIAVGYAISWYYQSPAILYLAVILAVGTNFYAYWASDKLVLSMNNARPATREEFFDFYTVAENMAITAGLPTPKLYVIDDPAPNAFATGRDEKHAVVCATTGLLSMMTRAELEGVVAHEMSHIKNRDMLLMTVAVVLAGFVAILAQIFLRMSFWGGGGRRNENGNAGALLAVLAIVGIILAPLAAKLIELAISRRREYLADASGVLLTRYPEGLASALGKLGAYQAPMRRANLATAHLFINDPFGAKQGSASAWIERLFSTHPPIPDRIKALLGNRAGA